MFGLSFGEVVLLVLVTLVVVGPRELPSMMRSLGRTLSRMRRMTTQLREQSGIDEILRAEGIDRELQELRKLAQGRLLDVNLDDVLEENAPPPPRWREYPPGGVDSFGTLPEDAQPYFPVPEYVVATAPTAPSDAVAATATTAPAAPPDVVATAAPDVVATAAPDAGAMAASDAGAAAGAASATALAPHAGTAAAPGAAPASAGPLVAPPLGDNASGVASETAGPPGDVGSAPSAPASSRVSAEAAPPLRVDGAPPAGEGPARAGTERDGAAAETTTSDVDGPRSAPFALRRGAGTSSQTLPGIGLSAASFVTTAPAAPAPVPAHGAPVPEPDAAGRISRGAPRPATTDAVAVEGPAPTRDEGSGL